ncbi:DNA polymerase delta subunit 4-like [Argonauta hians]
MDINMANSKQKRIDDDFKQKKPVFKSKSKVARKKIPLTGIQPSTSQNIQASCSKDSEELAVLSEFDLNWRFGPISGITRLERWERANKFCLNPPERVKNIILSHGVNTPYNTSLWDQNQLLKPL